MDAATLRDSIERLGFAVVADVLTAADLDTLTGELDAAGRVAGIHRRGGMLAIRNLLEVVPAVADVARSRAVRAIAETVLGQDCFAVRGILFDKTPVTNWKVAWHQDLTIAVRTRVDVPGYGAWSEKAGTVCVQPPDSVLEQMITVRLHVDDCGADNAPLRVVPGSHAQGRLSPEGIERWRARGGEVVASARRGAALVMRPLLLHASSAADRPGRRRVIHLDFAALDLPAGLEWQSRVRPALVAQTS